MRIKTSTLRRIIREEAYHTLNEAEADASVNPNRTWTTLDRVWAQTAGRSAQATSVLSDLKKIKAAVGQTTEINISNSIDRSINNFTAKKDNIEFANSVKKTIEKFNAESQYNIFQNILLAMSTETVASTTQDTQNIAWTAKPQVLTDLGNKLKSLIPVFIKDVKAWYTGPLTPEAGATAPAAPPKPATPPVTPAPPKPAAPPVQDWAGYIAKTPNGGAAVKVAWEANSKVTGQSPGFAAFVAWWRGMQKTRGQSWKGDPANITAQLNTDTKLKTPAAAATPSIPAGVPGQAVAAESFKRAINILNENNHLQLKNLKITWGK